MAYIEAKDYTFNYHGAGKTAISIRNLSVEKGEAVLIIGRSGCGKTTLLRRIVEPKGYRGTEAGTLKRSFSSYGYVWQEPAKQIVCSRVEQEIVFGMENAGISVNAMRRRLAEIVTFFGLETLIHREVHCLSAGEMQTVNVAGQMAMNPELMVFDESTSSLDPCAADRLAGLIRKIHEEMGTTMLIASQRPELFFEMADRILVMDEGEIVFNGDYEGLLQNKTCAVRFLPKSLQYALCHGAVPGDVATRAGRRLWFMDNYNSSSEEANASRKNKHKTIETDRIELKSIRYRYAKNEDDVLKDCSSVIHKGVITAIAGGNGSGKSTLADVLAGVRKPYMGKLRGIPEKVAYLPSDPSVLFISDTIHQEIEAFEADESFEHLLSLLEGIDTERHPLDISGGEKQRLGIAVTLAKNAGCIILDEPTKGLDPYWKDEMIELLKKESDDGNTIILITHDIEFAAMCADEITMLYDGRMSECEETKAFLTGNTFYTTEWQRLLSQR